MPNLEIERDYDGHFTGIDRHSPAVEVAKEADQALRLMSGALEQVRVAQRMRRDAERSAQIAQEMFRQHDVVAAPEAYLFLVSPQFPRSYEFTFTETRRRSCPYDDTIELKRAVPAEEHGQDACFVASGLMAVYDEEFPFRAVYSTGKRDNLELDYEIIALSGQERISLTSVDQAGELNLVNGRHPQEIEIR